MQVDLVLEGHQIAGFPTTHAVQLRLYVLDLQARTTSHAASARTEYELDKLEEQLYLPLLRQF